MTAEAAHQELASYVLSAVKCQSHAALPCEVETNLQAMSGCRMVIHGQ